MFKFVKSPNSSVVPEIITAKAMKVYPIKRGCIYFIADDAVVPYRPIGEIVLFYAIESLPEGHDEQTVRGFLITPGMIFEADTISPFVDRNIGDSFTFNTHSTKPVEGVLPSLDGDGNSYGILLSNQPQEDPTSRVYIMFT